MVKSIEVGLPSACLLPIGKYIMQETGAPSSVEVPISGTFEDGSVYNICPEDGIVLMGELVKVLYNLNKYPRLVSDERLIIMGLDTDLEEGTVTVVGRIVKFLGKEDDAEQSTPEEAGE